MHTMLSGVYHCSRTAENMAFGLLQGCTVEKIIMAHIFANCWRTSNDSRTIGYYVFGNSMCVIVCHICSHAPANAFHRVMIEALNMLIPAEQGNKLQKHIFDMLSTFPAITNPTMVDKRQGIAFRTKETAVDSLLPTTCCNRRFKISSK